MSQELLITQSVDYEQWENKQPQNRKMGLDFLQFLFYSY